MVPMCVNRHTLPSHSQRRLVQVVAVESSKLLFALVTTALESFRLKPGPADLLIRGYGWAAQFAAVSELGWWMPFEVDMLAPSSCRRILALRRLSEVAEGTFEPQ